MSSHDGNTIRQQEAVRTSSAQPTNPLGLRLWSVDRRIKSWNDWQRDGGPESQRHLPIHPRPVRETNLHPGLPPESVS